MEEPPDAENIEEYSRSPAEMERCLDPRAAKDMGTTRRNRGTGRGAHVVGRGLASRLRRMTRPKRTRVKEKLNEIVVSLNRSAGKSDFIL